MLMFKNYIEEIKNRVILILISWLLSIIICYNYIETIIYIIIKPGLYLYTHNNLYFIYTNLNEIFYTYMYLIITCANHLSIHIYNI